MWSIITNPGMFCDTVNRRRRAAMVEVENRIMDSSYQAYSVREYPDSDGNVFELTSAGGVYKIGYQTHSCNCGVDHA